MYHSATPIILCPGLIEVIEFGTIFEVNNYGRSFKTAAETTITTFSKIANIIILFVSCYNYLYKLAMSCKTSA